MLVSVSTSFVCSHSIFGGTLIKFSCVQAGLLVHAISFDLAYSRISGPASIRFYIYLW